MATINELMLELDLMKIAEGEKKHGKYKHGYADTNIYQVWHAMKRRCLNHKNTNYKNYGERNITVCDSWKNNPKSFCDWALANGYAKGLQLDRINNDGNYEPSNCRFVTSKINNNNQRPRKKKSNLPVGVVSHRKKFRAQITMNCKYVCLGSFNTLEEAEKMYNCVKRIYLACLGI